MEKPYLTKGFAMPQITIDTSEEVTISKKVKYQYPPYFMAGNGNGNRHGRSLNLIETLCSLSKPEQFAFMRLIKELTCVKDSRNKHNLCKVIIKNLTSAEAQRFKAGITSLISKDLVKRYKKEHYIINPNLIISKEYSEDMDLWTSTK